LAAAIEQVEKPITGTWTLLSRIVTGRSGEGGLRLQEQEAKGQDRQSWKEPAPAGEGRGWLLVKNRTPFVKWQVYGFAHGLIDNDSQLQCQEAHSVFSGLLRALGPIFLSKSPIGIAKARQHEGYDLL